MQVMQVMHVSHSLTYNELYELWQYNAGDIEYVLNYL
jgi:hypothetical protein